MCVVCLCRPVVLFQRIKYIMFLLVYVHCPSAWCHRIDYDDDSPETQSGDVDDDSEQTLDR